MAKLKSDHGYTKIQTDEVPQLARIPTLTKTQYASDRHYKEKLDSDHAALEAYQTVLYAGREKALLIVFQGMDTSGKDGAIKHVMSGVNPQGCNVTSFKTPTAAELEHDFFWRIDQAMPARGLIGIFNRSYYEEVLITRVHPELLKDEKLPSKGKHGHKFWSKRYADIVHHEAYLHRQGYEIIKIFIHISKAEQKKRLLARFRGPKKEWKISESDIRERAFWGDYQRAYEECLGHTSSKSCPWYVVPGDDKKNARLMISQIILKRFKAMKLRYPELTPAQKRNLVKLKATLEKE